MSGLIKAEQLADVRSLGPLADQTGSSPAAETLIEARERLLEDQLAKATAELDELKSSLEDQLKSEFELGREAGLKERDESAVKRLRLIEAGIARAFEAWDKRLEAMNGLAIQIARTVLARMIGNPEWRADFIAQAIVDRLGRFDQGSEIGIRVSSADFPDEGLPAAEAGNVTLTATKDLPSGECIIDLGMGHLSLGPDAQWVEAARLLDQLAEEASRSC